MSLRILVTGASGMLGSELLLQVPAGCEAVGTDLRASTAPAAPPVAAVGTDLCDEQALQRLFQTHGPFQGVIHCAAWTAVDLAEERPAEAARVNIDACRVLARAAARAAIPLVLVSTDFVFDGERSGAARVPYVETDEPRPVSVYGWTKLEGERAALGEHPEGTRIARTQWLYGPRGKHFPGTILDLARSKGRLKVVDDQFGSPTSTLELAPALWDLLRLAPPGIYHAACEGVASWYELAAAALELAGPQGVLLERCGTSEFPRPARRPAYSPLGCAKLARVRGRKLGPWRSALETFLAREGARMA